MILPKPEGCVRFVGVQSNGWPAFASMEKSKNTVQATKDSEADVVGYAEIGVNIPNLKEEGSIHARFQHKIHAPKVNFASNRHHQSTSPHLPGGVGIVTTFEATTRHKGVGNDPTGLARWVSVLMEGRENHKTRFVQAYNPCFSTLLNSVYQQHVRHLRDEKRKEHPHKAFEKDFKAALVEWLGNGDSVVVSIDANQDVLKDDCKECLPHWECETSSRRCIPTFQCQQPMHAMKTTRQLMPSSPTLTIRT